MSFLNAMGRVSRHGQWRLRRVLRAGLPDGRLDLSDAGLIDFSTADEIRLTVTTRQPYRFHRHADATCHGPAPLLSAAMTTGTLAVSNPGIIEAVFPTGWAAHAPAGLYDVRVLVTVGPETECVFDQPVEIA